MFHYSVHSFCQYYCTESVRYRRILFRELQRFHSSAPTFSVQQLRHAQCYVRLDAFMSLWDRMSCSSIRLDREKQGHIYIGLGMCCAVNPEQLKVRSTAVPDLGSLGKLSKKWRQWPIIMKHKKDCLEMRRKRLRRRRVCHSCFIRVFFCGFLF